LTPAGDAAPLAAESISARIEAVGADETIAAEAKETILAELRAALEAVRQREVVRAEAASLRAEAEDAPGQIQALQEELATPPEPVEIEADPEMPLPGVRQAVQTASADVDAARAELQRLQAESTTRTTRLEAIPREIAELRAALAELEPLPAEEAGTPAGDARRLRREAERALVEARIARLEAEAASYRARQDLLPMRRDRAQRRVTRAEARLEAWQAIERRRLQAEAARKEREAREAEQKAARLAPPLQELAQETARYASMRAGEEGVVEQLTSVVQRLTEVGTALRELSSESRSTIEKVEQAGLSQAMGLTLRNELGRLPELPRLRRERSELRSQLSEAQYQRILVKEALDEVSDIEAAVPRVLSEISAAETDVSEAALESATRELLRRKDETLEALHDDYSELITRGAELDARLTEYIALVDEYESYIAERILWTRSVAGRRAPSLANLADAALWLVSAPQWAGVGSALATGVVEPQPQTVAMVLALAATAAASVLARRRLATIAGKVRRFSTDRFYLTPAAVLYTLVLAAPPAVAIWTIATALRGTEGGLAGALATSLPLIGVLVLVLEFIRQAMRTGGLADTHFRWAKPGVADLRRWVLVTELAGLPLALLVLVMENQANEPWNNALGRVAFMALMLLLAGIYAVAFAPGRVLAAGYINKNPQSLIARAKWAWYGGLIAVPLAMAALAGAGYYYTAIELDRRFQFTLWLLIGIVLVHSVVLRWLFVERRRLAVYRARQRREAEAAEESGDERAGDVEQAMEVPAIDTQTRRVVRAAIVAVAVVGIYGLWADVLPALGVLDRVQIYPSITVLEEGTEPAIAPAIATPAADGAATQGQPAGPGMGLPGAPGGGAQAGASEPVGSVTLDEVGIAIIVVILTFVLSRNLPGLLEITLLKRLPLDSGSRFAISAVTRYALSLVGILAAFGAVGIGWGQVQWLAAALTFGLAFGLQEIFANFVSGLIMLAERPVRVGDTVTVGGLDGIVTRIQMRATTVRDWNRREMIIPNKVFVTDKVVNWTLSDAVVRAEVAVGVSYGADVRLAEQALLEIARTQAHVLADPKPYVLFKRFGDSTLDFELRVFLEHFDYYLVVIHDLHMRITEKFRELNIEIAFPQRDLHVRSVNGLSEIMVKRGDPTPEHQSIAGG